MIRGFATQRHQEKLSNRRDQFESQKTKMKQLEESWRPELDQLIAKIDRFFSTFMSNLGCAGEVSGGLRVVVGWFAEVCTSHFPLPPVFSPHSMRCSRRIKRLVTSGGRAKAEVARDTRCELGHRVKISLSCVPIFPGCDLTWI